MNAQSHGQLMNITATTPLTYSALYPTTSGNGHVQATQTNNNGIPISEGESLMHLVDLQKSRKFAPAPLKEQLQLSSPESIRKFHEENGNQRDTTAIVYLDDAPIMLVGKFTTSRNSLGDIMARHNGDAQRAISELEARYGNRVQVERFSDNNRPTNAEAYELFHKKSYAEFITDSYASMVASQAQQERESLAFKQQQLAYANAPIEHVYKVEGKIIASQGSDGIAEFQLGNLLSTLDQLNISRDEAKSLFTETVGKSVSHDEFNAMLKEVVGEGVTTDSFSGDERPTRQNVSATARVQYQAHANYL
jgi:hypothetical protein